MRLTREIAVVLAGALLQLAAAHARPPMDGAEAAVLLSRFPAGSVPVDPMVMTAIHVLGEDGEREDISLLRNLAEHERAEVGSAAMVAIAHIRGRQRDAQREDFAKSLPDWEELDDASSSLRAEGLGREGAVCAAYSRVVLGETPSVMPVPEVGDASYLLDSGQPRKAVAALAIADSDADVRLLAIAWEDMGESRGALQQYLLLAAHGDTDSLDSIDHFGVDSERLLLGLLARPEPHFANTTEAEILAVLVGSGQHLTVMVFAERGRSPVASDRATAVDALSRMLDPTLRDVSLSPMAQKIARDALMRAASDPVESIRAIAEEALSG